MSSKEDDADWRWGRFGLYDGEVPIVWATCDRYGTPTLGVFADYEDILVGLPTLLAERDALRKVCEALKEAETALTQRQDYRLLFQVFDANRAALLMSSKENEK
jgi:hypothetical protein